VTQPLHRLARVAAVAGAVGAVGLTLYAGRGSGQQLVKVLMAGWVFAPFFGYALVSRFTGGWTPGARAALDVVVLAVAVAALVVYARDALQPPPRRAGPYVLVPVLSWLVLLMAAAAGWVTHGRAPLDENRGQ
jgi:hypothetical protein